MSADHGDSSANDDRLMVQVEIYRCGTEMEVNRVVDELLGPAGIGAFVHDRTSHSLPSRGGMGSFFVAVSSQDRQEARQRLLDARAAGELDPDSGAIIEATDEG